VVEPEVVPVVVVPEVVVPEVVEPEVVVPSVVPRGLALPAGVPLMSLADVVPLVVRGAELPEVSAFSEAVQALNTASDEHKSAPVSTARILRFISRKIEKEAEIDLPGIRTF
jgi:cell pole-organizing protein PopZ